MYKFQWDYLITETTFTSRQNERKMVSYTHMFKMVRIDNSRMKLYRRSGACCWSGSHGQDRQLLGLTNDSARPSSRALHYCSLAAWVMKSRLNLVTFHTLPKKATSTNPIRLTLGHFDVAKKEIVNLSAVRDHKFSCVLRAKTCRPSLQTDLNHELLKLAAILRAL